MRKLPPPFTWRDSSRLGKRVSTKPRRLGSEMARSAPSYMYRVPGLPWEGYKTMENVAKFENAKKEESFQSRRAAGDC